VYGALQIRAGEGRTVALLTLLSCIIGGTIALNYTAANALFLATIGASGLPYVYITSALFLASSGSLFSWAEARLPFRSLLLGTLGAVLLSTLVLYLALWLSEALWLLFMLAVWEYAIAVLLDLVFSALAGHLFNLEQAKRLYGLVGSGELIVRVLVYFSVALLVGLIGTVNLLLLSAVSTAAALVLLVVLLRERAGPAAEAAAPTPAKGRAGLRGLLSLRYVRAILLLALLVELLYFVVEYVFAAQAEARFPDADQLASFFGLFFGLVYGGSFLASAVVSGWLLRRWGIRLALLLAPVTLLVGATASTAAGLLGGSAALFWPLMSTKFADEMLRSSVFRNAFQLLYQPLRPEQRLSAQTLTQSIVEPLAVGLSGLLLLVFQFGGAPGATAMSALIGALALAWLALTLLVYRGYIAALARALARRVLQGVTLNISDAAALALIEQRLDSPQAAEALYALDLLDRAGAGRLPALLVRLLAHPHPELRREAAQRIEARQLLAALPELQQVASHDANTSVRAAALRALATLDPQGTLALVVPFLDAADPVLRFGALVGLLRQREGQGVTLAVQHVLALAGSTDPRARALAARAVGEAGASRLSPALATLLDDADLAVRTAALRAAGQLAEPGLWPRVLASLEALETRSAAMRALARGGEQALPALRASLASGSLDTAQVARLLRVCRRMQNPHATGLLRELLVYPDERLRDEAARALDQRGYRADGDAPLLLHLVRAEVGRAGWTQTALANLGGPQQSAILQRALRDQLERQRARVLTLLSFLYQPAALRLARDNLLSPAAERRAYAHELVETNLPPELRTLVLPVLRDAPGHGSTHTNGLTPILRVLIADVEDALGPWVRACALHSAAELGLRDLEDAAREALGAGSPLVREAAIWAVRRLSAPEEEGMLSVVEKVIILKGVELFASTSDEILAELAGLVEELEIPAGTTIFQKGEAGGSMYIVVEGRVRVHDGEHTLNELGDRDVFGEMALLDEAPRLASVTTLTDSWLLRLDQEPFFELMQDRIEVTRGVIRVLLRHVRARVEDLSVARRQIQELRAPEHTG
jgi:HEAT repeat protein